MSLDALKISEKWQGIRMRIITYLKLPLSWHHFSIGPRDSRRRKNYYGVVQNHGKLNREGALGEVQHYV
jgi:hypothetical protein